MPHDLSSPDVVDAIRAARVGAKTGATRRVRVRAPTGPFRILILIDWRDHWIYFLLLDRFNNPAAAPKGTWNQRFDFRHGGTFAGVTEQLDYLEALGVGALWLSPL